MTHLALVRPIPSMFWELRGCWATGRRVALALDADVARAEGHVSRVSATDAFVVIGDMLVPSERILSVHRPSRLGDSTFEDRPGARWAGRPRRTEPLSGQESMDFEWGIGC